ncbi:hypothetical protein [Vibrio breoganii]|uniref:hypothetical protein n=1 Tax=Vibrio breoganii TaxID=553239 RepID=UPI0002FC1FD5|nr:hypothetical protein [Vibrio breoganii]OED96260.1 hypothetical protein A1QG_13195 [Vibrio breoganii ZF-29]OEF86004.1 hypothetical protein B003_16715 [Vibrio breoganii 1C10]
MNKKIVFIGFENDYDKIGVEELKTIYDIRTININKTVRKVIKKLSLSHDRFHRVIAILIRLRLKLHRNSLVLLKDENDYIGMQKYSSTKLVLILRNTINELDWLKNKKSRIYSFDIKDCEKYNLLTYDQYAPTVKVETGSITSDIVFVGTDKGRSSLLKGIEKTLSHKYQVNISVIKDSNNSMTYLDYIKFQLTGKVILDIVKESQTTESMRFVEALSNGRKVITNNIAVKKHKLYNESNVMYFSNLTELSLNIDKFISTKFQNYNKQELSSFTSLCVLDKIIRENITLGE